MPNCVYNVNVPLTFSRSIYVTATALYNPKTKTERPILYSIT